MGKIKRIFRILFSDGEVTVSNSAVTNEIGFGPAEPNDKRQSFDRKAILTELKSPPVEIKKKDLNVKILKIKQIIASLKKKKMDSSIYQEALKQLGNRQRLTQQLEEHLSFYPNTTRANIEKLSEKYKLVFRNLQGITRDIPMAATKAIDKFCAPFEKEKISFIGDNFWLIAPVDWWQKKRDPILCAQSPFGNYFYILYAWDKEVDIVGELFE